MYRSVVSAVRDSLSVDSVSVLSHAHKNTVMEVKWNLNGNWLLTASRDHLCKLFDIRNLKEELQVFRGHKKEATGECEHPHLFTGRNQRLVETDAGVGSDGPEE